MHDINADFLNFPRSDEEITSKKILPSERFFNRESSWILFNQRVLEEASNEDVPLLERLRFLAISARNLDEFYSVRVAGFRQMVKNKIDVLSADGLRPEEQLMNIEKEAKLLIDRQQKLLPDILIRLQRKGINVIKKSDILDSEKKELEKKFISKIFPAITPLAIDTAHPFPFIPSEGSAIALKLNTIGKKKSLEVLVPIPGMLERFQKIRDGKNGEKRFLPLETFIVAFVENIFPGYKLEKIS
jgi:polyphosphate kinase